MYETNMYDDLINIDLGEKVLELQQENDNLHNSIDVLEKDVQRLCKELVQMKRIEENLKRNISELFKTAKTEIERKDRMIVELRRELDNVLFRRRRNKHMHDKDEKSEVASSSKSKPYNRYGTKRDRTDIPLEPESICNKKIKCESNALIKSERDSKERTSRSSSRSAYDQRKTRSREKDSHRNHESEIDRDGYTKNRNVKKNKEHSSSRRSCSRERDRSRKEKVETHNGDLDRHYSGSSSKKRIIKDKKHDYKYNDRRKRDTKKSTKHENDINYKKSYDLPKKSKKDYKDFSKESIKIEIKTDNDGDDHTQHLGELDSAYLNNKDALISKSSENTMANNTHKNSEFSSLPDTKENILEEYQNGNIAMTKASIDIKLEPLKNESITSEANNNDSMNYSGLSTDASLTNEEGVIGQNQSDRIRINARRRRCIIKILN